MACRPSEVHENAESSHNRPLVLSKHRTGHENGYPSFSLFLLRNRVQGTFRSCARIRQYAPMVRAAVPVLAAIPPTTTTTIMRPAIPKHLRWCLHICQHTIWYVVNREIRRRRRGGSITKGSVSALFRSGRAKTARARLPFASGHQQILEIPYPRGDPPLRLPAWTRRGVRSTAFRRPHVHSDS